MSVILTVPSALAGAVLLAPVVVLHLLHRRPPKRMVSTVRLYRTVEVDTGNRGRLGQPDWLLLVLDTVVVALLILAAAGPELRRPLDRPQRLPVVLIDRSASTGVTLSGEPRLKLSLDRAIRGLFEAEITEFWAYELSGPAPLPLSEEPLATDRLERMASGIDSAPVSVSAETMEAAVTSLLERHRPPVLVVVTDLVDWPETLSDQPRVVTIPPALAERSRPALTAGGPGESDPNAAISGWSVSGSRDRYHVQLLIERTPAVSQMFPIEITPVDPETGWTVGARARKIGVQTGSDGAATAAIQLSPGVTTARIRLDLEDGYLPDNSLYVHLAGPPVSAAVHTDTPAALAAAVESIPWIKTTEVFDAGGPAVTDADLVVSALPAYVEWDAPSIVAVRPEDAVPLPPSVPASLGSPTWVTGRLAYGDDLGLPSGEAGATAALVSPIGIAAGVQTEVVASIGELSLVVQFRNARSQPAAFLLFSLSQGALVYSPAYPILVRDIVALLVPETGTIRNDSGRAYAWYKPVDGPGAGSLGVWTRPLRNTDGLTEPGLVVDNHGRFLAANLAPTRETVMAPSSEEAAQDPVALMRDRLRESPTVTTQTVMRLRPFFAVAAAFFLGFVGWLRLRRLK